MGVLPACISEKLMHAVPTEAEEDIGYFGTGVTKGCKPPCWYWELKPCSLKEQPVLISIEPSF